MFRFPLSIELGFNFRVRHGDEPPHKTYEVHGSFAATLAG